MGATSHRPEKHARALAKDGGTGANRGNGGGNQSLCSLCSLLFKSGSGGVVEIDFNLANSEGINICSRRDGDADFIKFLAHDTSLSYVDNRPLLVAGKPELREYKAVFVVGDVEVSQFSDEITVNWAPLV